MPGKHRRNKQPPGGLSIVLGMFLGGIVLALGAAGLIWLFSTDTSGLPPAAKDLSTFNSFYLRAYFRFNSGTLQAPAARTDGVFEIQPGESAQSICQRLAFEGWVPSAELVVNYLVYTGGDRLIGSGLFLLRAGQNTREIADALVSGKSKVRSLTVFAGWRLEEIAQALPASGIPMATGDFLAAAGSRPGTGTGLDGLYRAIPEGRTLEGFLLPGAYTVPPGETAAGLVQRMALTFQQSIPPDWIAAYQTHGLDLYKAVTLASIVQREGRVDEELPMIASVFYNRLQLNMPLQTDPTVQYALGYQAGRGGWWANPLLDDDFSIDSPYNTFLYYGLPPGPISNPGLPALQAVAFPAESPYLFFRAACDESGRHNFAKTNAEHNANACGE
jgi:UPF0755 protein